MRRMWQTIIRPKRLEVDEETLSPTYGKFVAEPFERGFGITIGNALRRVLLSSIQGAAITAVRIDGILHEFSTVPGVKEDVTEIIMNLKEIELKLNSDGPEKINIKTKGTGVVKASDIIANNNVEILNPNQHIATLSHDAKLAIEMNVQFGIGYLPAEKSRDENAPIGTIPIDAIFSPVKRVNFNVNYARVGQMTDYERLTLEVWTDGSIAPEDAIAFAAKILQNQLKLFINFEDEIEVLPKAEPTRQRFNDNLYRSIDELELSVRSSNCLRNANIRYIWELVTRTEPEMLKTKNFGRKSLNEIKEILSEMGLTLGMKLDGFEPPSRRDEDLEDIDDSDDMLDDDQDIEDEE
ncbi:MAG: DNA-directed RNA polymerase subunit alpha [Proteobacteria bacterium]|jgi:DNA-directed RNA polymerase subunit alpha|nr:DNA-directed RNA polymerase subunit alpha [Pseudomonadota bacterium]